MHALLSGGALAVATLLFVTPQALAQDECATATVVALGANGPFDSTGSTVSAPAWGCSSVTGGDVWYSFTTSALGGLLTIDTEGSTGLTDTVLQVFDSCGGASIACDDDGGTGLLSKVSFAAAGATTYFARVGGFGGSFGTHFVNVAYVTPDECAGALPIVDGLNGPFNSTGSTNSLPAGSCGSINRDIWFIHTASCNGSLAVQTEGPGTLTDTLLEAWSACGGAVLACDDDGGLGLYSLVTIPVVAGTQYIFRVGGFGITPGTFNIRVTNTPAPGGFPNECACAGTLVLGANAVTTVGSTVSSPAWTCVFVSGGDTWYTYTVAGPGCVDLTVDTLGSGVDTGLEVWSSCGGALLGCNDDVVFPPGESQVVLTSLAAGTSVVVRAARFGGATSAFTINVSETPALPSNDECVGAIVVAVGDNGPFSSTCATTSLPAMPCVFGFGKDLWYEYTATCTGPHRFSTCLSSFDTGLEVFTGLCGALTSIGCNDDSFAVCGAGFRSSLTLNLVSGTVYKIRIGGFSGASGTQNLRIEIGTGTGTIAPATTVSACKFGLTFAVTGSPNIGNSITLSVGGLTGGIPACGFGFLPNAPIGLPCGCTVITSPVGSPGEFYLFSSSQVLPIPCDVALIGAQGEFQGFEFFGASSCTVIPGIDMAASDIWTVTVG